MDAADLRKSKLRHQIQDQIEEVAKSICEGGDAIEAMHMLNNLTRELVTEEKGITSDQVPVGGRMEGAPALHCPHCRSALHGLRIGAFLCYHCQSGHTFSARSLLSIKAHARYAHLFSLCEDMIEEATLARYLANESSFADAPFTNESLNQRADELMQEADHLSMALLAIDGSTTTPGWRRA